MGSKAYLSDRLVRTEPDVYWPSLRAHLTCARRELLVPASMISPLSVRRSTMATHTTLARVLAGPTCGYGPHESVSM